MTVVDPRRERQERQERALLNDPVRRKAMAAEMTADDEQKILLAAARLVVTTANGSWRMLHDKLRIGQGHAQRVLQILEMHDVVGPEVAGQRRVLVNKSDLDTTLARLCTAPGDEVAEGGGAAGGAGAQDGEPGAGPGVDLVKRDRTALAEPAETTPAIPEDDEDDEPDASDERPRRLLVGRVVRGGSAVVTTLRQGEGRVARTTRGGARYVYVVGQGVWSWLHRAAKASDFAHARDQLRMARVNGIPAEIKEWESHLKDLRKARIDRMKDAPQALKGLAVTVVIGGGFLMAILVGVGVLAGIVASAVGSWGWAGWTIVDKNGRTSWHAWDFSVGWQTWWWAFGWFCLLIAVIVVVSAFSALTFSVPVAIAKAHTEGSKAANPPRWLLTRDELHNLNSEVTLDSISAAMAHMKMGPLTRALKEGALLEFIVQPREQGGGTYFQLRLPLGSMAADFLPSAKVELLAANLARHKHEVWPQRQADSDARVLDCWIADKGTMDQPAPVWPLLHEGTFDVFRDRAPLGVTMRRDPVLVGMLQKHWLIGANSKQGKTTLLRLMLLCLALDPTVELRIADLKGDGDLRCLRNRCHTYIEGSTDEDAEAACIMLEGVLAEMKRRYAKKAELNLTGPITRTMSRRKGSGFHPIYATVDECQVMYMMGKSLDGESYIGGTKDESRAQAAAKRLHDQARAVNIHLVQATQRPDPQTMPVRVREGVHVRVCLWVPKLSAAEMILAEAADQGARPYDLRPGVDAGTAVFAGEVEDIPVGQAFTIVKSYYVNEEDAMRVATRAIAAWKAFQQPAPLVIDSGQDPAVIDVLQDIYNALRGEDKVLTRDVRARLKEDKPDVYGDWSARDLADALEEYELYGVKIRKSDGDSKVFAEDILRALHERPKDLP